MQNIGAALELLKNCKLNNNKTKLICEVELAKTENFENNKIKDNNLKVVKQIDNDNPVSTKVKYSERRDKIRFKDKESGEYQTSTTDEITDKDVEDKIRDIAERYGSTGSNVDELIKNPTDQMKEYVREELKYDLAVKFIMDNVK